MSWLKLDASKSIVASLLKMRAELTEWDALTFFDHLRQYFQGTLPQDEKAKIDVVIDLLNLNQKVDEIKEVVEKVPESAWQLFSPLSQLSQPLELSLFNKAKSFNPVKGPWGATLGFDLTSNVTAQAFTSRENVPIVPDLAAEAGKAFFQVGGLGILKTELGGSVRFTHGSVQAGLRAGGQIGLDYVFRDHPPTLVGAALLEHGSSLCSPFALKQISKAFKKNLRAIHFETEGQLQLQGGLTVGQTWGTTYHVKNDALEVDTRVGLDASANVGIQAGVRLAGGFDLLIQPASSGWVSVKLTRSEDRGKNLNFNLNAQVDISGLDVIGHAILVKYVPDAQPLINKLTPYLDLGTMLRSKMTSHVRGFLGEPANAALRDQLINTLTGVGSANNLSEALLDLVMQSVNQQLDVWETEANQTAAGVLDRVGGRLGLDPNSQATLFSGLQSQLSEELNSVKVDLTKDLAKWLDDQPAATLQKLFKPLEAFGAKVNDLVGQVQELVDKLLKPLLKWLDRYQALRLKLQKAVDGAARLKFGLNFSRMLATGKATDVLLEIELDSSNRQANDFYKQILWGSFSELIQLLRKASDDGQMPAGVRLKGGHFKATLTKRVQTDFSVDFAGKPGGTTTLRDLKLEASWDLAGNVQTAHGTIAFKREFKLLGEQRSASFVNALELAGSHQHMASKIFSSSVSLAFKDQRIKPKEIRKLLGSLEKVDLVASGTVASAIDHYRAMDHEHAGAAIGLSMPLEGDGLKRFLKQTQKQILLTGFEKNRQIFLEKKKARQAFDKFMDTKFEASDLLAKIKFILKQAATPQEARSLFGGNSTADKTHAYNAWTFSRNAKALAKMQSIMKKIAKIPLDDGHAEENLKKIYKLMDALNKEVAIVLKVRKWLGTFFGKDSVPKATLAFMVTLRELSEKPGQGTPLLPVIRWSENGEDVESILVNLPEN